MTKADKAAKSRAVREFRERRDAAICRLFSEGVEPTKIHQQLNCGYGTVTRVIALSGLRKARVRKTTPDDRDLEMIQVYRSGASLRKVAARFGVRMQRVHQIVKRWAPEVMRAAHVGRYLVARAAE